MKLIDWLLLAAVVFIIYRLTSERTKTDGQLKQLQAAIPDPAKLAPVTIIQQVPAPVATTTGGGGGTPTEEYTPVDYAENYEQAKS